MNSVNDVFIFGVSGTDANNFNLRGGVYQVALAAESWGTVTLNVLAADQTTWVPFQTWSANAAAVFTLVAGLYQFAYSGIGVSTLSIAQQPPTPNWRLQSLSQPLPINADAGATNYQTLPGYDSITLETPNSSGLTGSIEIATGDSSGGNSGDITLHCGSADGAQGQIVLVGRAISAPSGFVVDAGADPVSLTVSSNNSDNGAGSDVTLQAGPGGDVSGNGGNINLNVGTATSGNAGLVIISALPTSASGLPSGALWNSSGTLKVA